MKIKQTPEDFQVEELLELPLTEGGAYTVYLLEKRSMNTLDALNGFARALKVQKSDVSFAGLKDRHTISRQHVSVRNGPEESARGKGFSARPLGRSESPVSAERLMGNAFRIVVRDLTKAQAKRFSDGLRGASRDGLPNYFGEQRFGSARHGKGFIAERMAHEDFESALRLFMAYPARKDSATRKALIRKIASLWGRWDRLARELPHGTERRIATHLSKNPGDFAGALDRIDRQLMSLFLHAWQGWLWNRVAAEVLRSEPGLPELFQLRTKFGNLLFFGTVSKECRERLARLEIPLPSTGRTPAAGPIQAAAEKVLSRAGVRREDLNLKGVRSFFKGGLRPLLFLPRDLHVGNPQPDERNPGRRKVRFSTTLPPGSYATILIQRASAAFSSTSRKFHWKG